MVKPIIAAGEKRGAAIPRGLIISWAHPEKEETPAGSALKFSTSDSNAPAGRGRGAPPRRSIIRVGFPVGSDQPAWAQPARRGAFSTSRPLALSVVTPAAASLKNSGRCTVNFLCNAARAPRTSPHVTGACARMRDDARPAITCRVYARPASRACAAARRGKRWFDSDERRGYNPRCTIAHILIMIAE